MTTKQRRQYLTLHAVRELVRGMGEHRQCFEKKTRESLRRIERRVTAMIEALGQPTRSDQACFARAADKLNSAWVDEGGGHSQAAFVAIGLALVAEQRAEIPAKAAKARQEFADLEGMLATLYRHFDPDYEDMVASDEGEAVAREYRQLVAA
ncbi:hypothetical protein [Desulfovibrio oxyclinae]|uniref:hypothetical protein n=1 Tax=Desulfovibrio oxyclinae TaxID=63560 RepID=UPI000369FAA8|nr:hypothetical protein [Desulfovibrio oxyclinae]